MTKRYGSNGQPYVGPKKTKGKPAPAVTPAPKQQAVKTPSGNDANGKDAKLEEPKIDPRDKKEQVPQEYTQLKNTAPRDKSDLK